MKRQFLLSDGLYRKYRQFIPLVDDWCWTLTPWTCTESFGKRIARELERNAK